MHKTFSGVLFAVFFCIIPVIYGHQEIIELSSSSLILEYRKDNTHSDRNYIILPQNSYQKIKLLHLVTSEQEIIPLESEENLSEPVSLDYRGTVHFFHLFQIRISPDVQLNSQRYSLQTLKYEIYFSEPIELTQKPYNTYMEPFFSKEVINPEHLPFFVSRQDMPEEIQERLAFFTGENDYFYFRNKPGFYEINLNNLREIYPNVQGKKALLFDHTFNKIPSYQYSNRLVFFQPFYEDEFTDKSVIWLVFSPDQAQERLNLPVRVPEFITPSQFQDYCFTEYLFPAPRNHFFPGQNPDDLPDARDAVLYHLSGQNHSQNIIISPPQRSAEQPDMLPLHLTFANPTQATNFNYRFLWNDVKIGELRQIERAQSIPVSLNIPVSAFRGVTNHTLTIINEDAPQNVVYLTDLRIQYNSRLQVREPLIINTSLEQTGNHLRFPTIYHEYPLVFLRENEIIYRYSYQFDERYNYAGDRLISVTLPSQKTDGGLLYFFPPGQIPQAEPVHFIPPLNNINEEVRVLVITDPEFLPVAEQYTTLHSEFSISTHLVEDLYLLFQGGLKIPYALKDFLQYKLISSQNVIPEFAVLLGDCTNDYKNRLQTDINNYVPSLRYYRGREGFASDYMFSTILGQGFFSDIIIARLPFNSRQDIEQYLDKAEHYKNPAGFDDWNYHIAYFADNEGFDEYCKQLYSEIPPVLDTTEIYLKDYFLEDNFYIPWEVAYQEKIKVSPDCTKDILDTIQDGVAFIQYMGHGAPNILSHERILFGGNSSNSDFLNLSPNYRPTFMSMMTCSTGAIDYPLPPWNINISEDFLRTKGSGAIALFVPSGKGYPTQHMVISRILQDYIFRENTRNFGAIVSNTLNSYHLKEKNEFHTAMFLLLGDPLLNLQLPKIMNTIEITPRLAGKSSPSALSVSHPFPANEPVSAFLTKTGGITKNIELSQNLEIPEEEGKYFLAIRDEEIVHFGDFQVMAYSQYADKSRFQETPSAGENTFLFSLSNTSDIDWYDGIIFFSLIDLNTQKEIRASETGFNHIAPGKNNSFSFPVHLSPGIYETRISVNISGIPSYENHQQWFVPFETPCDEPVVMIIPSQEAHYSGQRDIPLQFRMFNPCALDLHEIDFTYSIDGIAPPYYHQDTLSIPAGKEVSWNHRTQYEDIPEIESGSLDVSFTSPGVSIIPQDFKIPVKQPAHLELASPLIIEPPSPFEGQSLFFKVTVINTGDRQSSQSLLRFYEEKEGEEPRTIQVTPNAYVKPLAPGEKQTFRYHHTPWKNHGDYTYQVSIDENLGSFDPQYAKKEISVRKNFEFKTHRALTLGPQSEEDLQQRAVYLQAIFSNTGERDAHGVIVNFYRSSAQVPENKIGDVYIDTVEAGKTYRAPIRWENVPDGFVSWTFNVGLKVSTARVSYLGEAVHDPDEIRAITEDPGQGEL